MIIQYRVDKAISDYKMGRIPNAEDIVIAPIAWLILAGTGLRPIELSHLKTYHVGRGNITIGEDFSTKVLSERRVPLLFESRQAVEFLCNNSIRERSPRLRDSDYLLGVDPSRTKRRVSREFTAAWKACFPNEPHKTLYNLKDMFCVRFLTDPTVPSSSGLKLNDLKDILGHSSLSTTQKYLKAIPFGTSIEGLSFDYSHVIW